MADHDDDPSKLDDAQWRVRLNPEQFRVLRLKGTERAFTGHYDHHFEKGTYKCAGCGAPLFVSDHKFDSGCGWPAFDTALPGKVAEEVDLSHGMRRVEVHCARCGGHLGHVFPDGPRETTGMRYCINSVSLAFEGEGDE